MEGPRLSSRELDDGRSVISDLERLEKVTDQADLAVRIEFNCQGLSGG